MKPLLSCLDCGALGPWQNRHGVRCRRCERIREWERAAAYRPLRQAKPQGPCVRCGATEDLTWDHVVPIKRGGGSENGGVGSPGNLQVLCRRCNSAKRDRRDSSSGTSS